MNTYIESSDDEIKMAFVASCIEDLADRLEVPYIEVFERMERIGLLDKYIFPCYDVLHTESRENLTSILIDTLRRWENDVWQRNYWSIPRRNRCGRNPELQTRQRELTKMMPYVSISDADAPLSVAAEPGLQYGDRSLTPGDITSQIRNPEG